MWFEEKHTVAPRCNESQEFRYFLSLQRDSITANNSERPENVSKQSVMKKTGRPEG